MIDFYPRLTTSTQAGETEVRGWDPKAKEKIVGKAAAGDENSKMGGSTGGPAAADAAFGAAVTTWVDMPVATQAEADQVALGQYQRMALAYITGEGLCRGRTDLRAGTVIKVDGVGKRFSGQYYVTSAVHTYSPAVGYRTAFSIRRNAT